MSFTHSIRRLSLVAALGAALALPATLHAQAVTVQYMDWKLNDSKKLLDFFQELAKEFNAANPDIRVELVPVQWEQRMQKLMTEMQAGVPRDVVRVTATDMAGIFPLLQPVDAPLRAIGAYDGIISQIPPRFLADYDTRDGKLYGVPMSISADGLMYNKKMFAAAGLDPNKPPKTWAEFLEYAKKLTKPPNQYGYVLFGAKSGSSARRWLRVFWDAGCEFISRDFKRATFAEKPACVAAFKREIDYARVEKITPPGAANADFEFVINGFAQERIAMHMGGPNNADIANAKNPGVAANFALAPMPESGAALANGDSLIIPAGSKRPREAARWLAFLSSKDVQVRYALAAKASPSRRDALADPRIKADPFLAFSVPDNALFSGYGTPKWPKVETVMMDMVQASLLGDETPEVALARGTKEINAILAAP
jgi:multiple sugar transport system substrate-binding protein